MRKIIFATNNRNKLREVSQMLKGVELSTPQDHGIMEDIPETAETLEGNASQKSRYIYDRVGVDCFSDDTGLEVDALDGAPGVYSARYAGEQKDANDNMTKLLGALSGNEDRKARFRTVISLIIAGKEHFFEGVVEGRITKTRSGAEGFGYDPVFVPDGYNKTFAEMDAETKNRISHRGRAVKKLVEFLNAMHE